MRIRPGLVLLIICGAGLSACTAGASTGPDVTVSTPAVGRPQPPSSVQAALSSEAFTPYAALGQSNNDGLAPGESTYALSTACMTAAGYSGTGNVPFSVRTGPANLGFSQPWGSWGYLGAADAQQNGFRLEPGSALSQLGIDAPGPGSNQASESRAEQTAIGKCATITASFANAVADGALAGIGTLSNDISDDVAKDPAVSGATRDWKACMARNGYSFTQPGDVLGQELQAMYGHRGGISIQATVSAAANQAQIATAVTDADCTGSADLAGIYFAVQASYEQQIVGANQQALTAAVQQYRAAYAKELGELAGLLKTASAQPFPAGPGGAAGRPSSRSRADLDVRWMCRWTRKSWYAGPPIRLCPGTGVVRRGAGWL